LVFVVEGVGVAITVSVAVGEAVTVTEAVVDVTRFEAVSVSVGMGGVGRVVRPELSFRGELPIPPWRTEGDRELMHPLPLALLLLLLLLLLSDHLELLLVRTEAPK
jgi:hypothetical protein